MARPLILGHRGYRARFPENTLLAFREALASGADGIECDVQKTLDSRYVVIHDPSTDRTTGVKGCVAEARLDELKTLDFGSREKIPALEEMLHALPPDAYLDLELKEETLSPEDADRIALILDSHRSRERLMISSFDPRLLFPFRRMEFTVGLLVGEEAAGRGLVGLASDLLRLRPHYVNLPVDMLRMFGVPRSVLICRILHTFGFSLLFWTVNDPEDAASVAPLARILVTDEVELIRKTTDS